MDVEVTLVDLRGPVVALADALQIKPGVLEVLLVDLPELRDVDLGLEGNLAKECITKSNLFFIEHIIMVLLVATYNLPPII